MLKNREAYLCLSAMLRAREGKMLNAERAERMLEAATFEDAAKLLTDCGYEDMSGMNAGEIETALTARKTEIMKELDRLAPDTVIADLFRMKYDYHNVKVLLKSEAMGQNPDKLLSGAGRIPAGQLKELYYEGKYSSLPGALEKATPEAKELLAKTNNPQQMDFLLDNAYFGELTALAEESGNDFLKGYVRLLIDCANLKSTVRTLRMGKNREFLQEALFHGGNVSTDRLLMSTDKESLCDLFAHTGLEKAAVLGAEATEGGALTAVERACDNAVNAYLGKAKLVSFGSEPLTAYFAALENEVTAARMILTGRLAGIRPDVLRERLRDLYA